MSAGEGTETVGDETPTLPGGHGEPDPSSDAAPDATPIGAGPDDAAPDTINATAEVDVAMARKQMSDLLNVARITRVFFVDDANSQTDSAIISVVAALEAGTVAVENLAVVVPLTAYLTEDGDLVDNRRAAELLGRDDLDPDIASAAVEAYVDTQSQGQQLPDQTAISIVRDLLPDGFEYREETLRTWPELVAELVGLENADTAKARDGSTGHGATLVLIDRDFSKESGRSDQGEQMVAELVKKAKGRSDVLVALVTHQIPPSDEGPRQAEITDAGGLGDDEFVVISKLRLNDDCVGFVRRVRDIVAWTTVQQLTAIVLSAASGGYESAAAQLRAVPLSELRRVLVYETKGDGVWEADQILRLLHAISDADLQRRLRADETAWHLTERLRRVSPEVAEPPTSFRDSAVRRLQRNEIYLSADVLSLGVGIDTGDIFRVVKLNQAPSDWTIASVSERYFIVLEQNCNTVVRASGRREPEINELAVGEVTLVEEHDGGGAGDGVSRFLLPMFCPDSGTDAVVRLNKRRGVVWSALDATVWGPHATSELPLDPDATPDVRLDDPWALRHAYAIKFARKIGNKVGEMLKDTALKPAARTVFLRGLLLMSWDAVPVDLTSSHLRFGVQRIARLREPYATLLRAKSGAYQARQALDAPLMSAAPAAVDDSGSEAERAMGCVIGSGEVDQVENTTTGAEQGGNLRTAGRTGAASSSSRSDEETEDEPADAQHGAGDGRDESANPS
jgi:hypothetical protein